MDAAASQTLQELQASQYDSVQAASALKSLQTLGKLQNTTEFTSN